MGASIGSHWRRSAFLAVTALWVLTGLGFAYGSQAWRADGTPAEDRARGVVWDGLETDRSACPGAFRLVDIPGDARCSHGPDPAPPGIDVRLERTTEELVAGTNEGSLPAGEGTVACQGDGVSGKRVQAVYAHASDVEDRSDVATGLIGSWAGNVDRIFADSAAATGGVRHVRWVTEPECRLSVLKVRMATTGDDSMSNTISELKSAGLTRTDRKYLVWVDANRYCGMAEFRRDDRAGSANANESGPSFARVDVGCWGLSYSAEAHELMHLLGGVQSSAPNATAGAHCTDENDRMCYADSQSVVVTYPCTYEAERLFDCGHDDYFHTNPPAGSYLATHWNTATSSFLEGGGSSDGDESTEGADSSQTETTTWSGSLTKKQPSESYTVQAGAGSLKTTVEFSRAKKLVLTVYAADGSTVGTRSGANPVSLDLTVPAGTYTIEVSGGNASFTLTATYVSP